MTYNEVLDKFNLFQKRRLYITIEYGKNSNLIEKIHYDISEHDKKDISNRYKKGIYKPEYKKTFGISDDKYPNNKNQLGTTLVNLLNCNNKLLERLECVNKNVVILQYLDNLRFKHTSLKKCSSYKHFKKTCKYVPCQVISYLDYHNILVNILDQYLNEPLACLVKFALENVTKDCQNFIETKNLSNKIELNTIKENYLKRHTQYPNNIYYKNIYEYTNNYIKFLIEKKKNDKLPKLIRKEKTTFNFKNVYTIFVESLEEEIKTIINDCLNKDEFSIDIEKKINNYSFQYEITCFKDLAIYSLYYLTKYNKKIKRCKECGLYFIGNNKRIYCNRISKNGLSCCEIAHKKTRNNRSRLRPCDIKSILSKRDQRNNTTYAIEFDKRKKKMENKLSSNSITSDDWDNWLKKEYENSKIKKGKN